MVQVRDMSDAQNPRRQPDLYWRQLGDLKAASICIRLYRNRLASRVRLVELVKAIASGGGIAGWVIWRDWPLLWAAIIAAAQFLDATKHVFPFARLHKAASDLTVALELLYIEAEAEWEGVHSGTIPNEAITGRRARLARLRLEAEYRHFPEGFDPSRRLFDLANKEATDYLRRTYGQEPDHERL
jgi:hypothetical protein